MCAHGLFGHDLREHSLIDRHEDGNHADKHRPVYRDGLGRIFDVAAVAERDAGQVLTRGRGVVGDSVGTVLIVFDAHRDVPLVCHDILAGLCTPR